MRNKNIKLVTPVLKWVGGKRQLLPEIRKRIPKKYKVYYEPFLGGGAVLFDLQPKKAIVNDLNSELINVYKTIKSFPTELVEELRKFSNDEETFYNIRNIDRDKTKYQELSNIQKAARIIYLNKTCFNGLYRVNNAGEFNSPFGRYKNPNIVNDKTIYAVSKYFNTADITFKNGDFEESIKEIQKDSFVYLDPPYDPISKTSNFTGYNQGGFSDEEQIRIKNMCDRLNENGIKFLLSNSATPFIKELYKDYTIDIVSAKRSVNSKADKRGEIEEVLIRNYDINTEN